MRPGAFLTHDLLSLVTNVVSDVSLSHLLPRFSVPPEMLVASPEHKKHRDPDPTYHGQITRSQTARLALYWDRGPTTTGL